MTAAFLVAALVSAGASAGTALRDGEGVVVVARGHPILVQRGVHFDLVSPVRGAEISGVGELAELQPGDRVRYWWRSERAGVRLAERLSADPVLAVDPEFMLLPGHLEQELPGGRIVPVDARPRVRWEAGHLPGAISVPADDPRALALIPPPPTALAIYGESGRTSEAHRLLRRLLAAKRTDVRLVTGGFQAWESEGATVEVEVAAVARDVSSGRPLVFVDVRSQARALAEPLRGALSIPLEEMRPGEFSEKVRLPPVVLIGEDAADGSPHIASDRIRRWRFGPEFPPWRVVVLAGGASAWRAAGLSATSRAAREPLRWDSPGSDQISIDEFRSAWAAKGGGAVVLDVRGPRERPPTWVKHVPLEELADRIGELPRNRDIVVFCSAGYRSRVARELLVRNGFRTRYLWAAPDVRP